MKEEKYHELCKKLMDKIFGAEHTTIMPYSVLVEVVASVKRCTDSEELAENADNNLQNTPLVYFLELTKERALEASDIAKETGLKGMDSIVVQIAKENNSILITLDNEIINRVGKIANAVNIEIFDAMDAKNKDE